MTVDPIAKPALDAAIKAAGLKVAPGALGSVISISPGIIAILQHELEELDAAAEARKLWFAPLAPQTRYTLDVVAGPLLTGREDVTRGRAGGSGGLLSIFDASDAIGALDALQAFLAREDALTSLQRVQFTTSRYATFSDQVANVVAQSAGTAATPVRRYGLPAGTDAQTWLTGAAAEAARGTGQGAYLSARQSLAAVLRRFDPLWDVRQATSPADPTTGNGERALAAQRAATEQAWQQFATATATTFDGLITALGQPGLVSSQHVPPPPDTELSVFTSDDDTVVQALLLNSPEPLPWRRTWQWTLLQPDVRARPGRDHGPLVHGPDAGPDRADRKPGRLVHAHARVRGQHRRRGRMHHRRRGQRHGIGAAEPDPARAPAGAHPDSPRSPGSCSDDQMTSGEAGR